MIAISLVLNRIWSHRIVNDLIANRSWSRQALLMVLWLFLCRMYVGYLWQHDCTFSIRCCSNWTTTEHIAWHTAACWSLLLTRAESICHTG